VFRVPFYIAVVLLISFGGGIAATLAALKYTTSYGAVTIGAWRAFPLGQTLEADPYTKSHRANAGRLLYGTAEGLSFTANVTGNLPIARFWTLFTAGPDGRLTTTDDVRPLALNSRILLRDPNGGLDIDLSREARPFNWLAMQNIPNLTLVLNLFDTPIASSTGLIDIEMPTITKIGCGNV
jgi:hypothetical protein